MNRWRGETRPSRLHQIKVLNIASRGTKESAFPTECGMRTDDPGLRLEDVFVNVLSAWEYGRLVSD